LTTCAACAKTLEHDAPAHCVNCQTRYCSDRCLRYHAHRGGHDDACDEIARGGGAEQYHADKKYKEAVADAVEECAEDTEGQTCYICHGKNIEGATQKQSGKWKSQMFPGREFDDFDAYRAAKKQRAEQRAAYSDQLNAFGGRRGW